MRLSAEDVRSFEKNGFLILKDFVSHEDCNRLRKQIDVLARSSGVNKDMSVFSTGTDRQLKDRYFLESGDKIRFFLEEDSKFFNKCGHALHTLDPVFSEFSNSEKIRNIFLDLGLEDPIIVQSMYIFKHAGVGGKVVWHQDATFLYTEPNTLAGLWFALDDANRENGCLWAIPGGHKGPLRSRFHRVQETELAFQDLDQTPYEIENAIPLEVSKGSLVILHSLLPHMSEPNLSPLARHAYTLHAYDRSSTYPENNWLQ